MSFIGCSGRALLRFAPEKRSLRYRVHIVGRGPLSVITASECSLPRSSGGHIVVTAAKQQETELWWEPAWSNTARGLGSYTEWRITCLS